MYDVKPFTSPKQVDCGATCLQMLLDFYGIDAGLEELIEACNTRIVGCSAKDLVNAGKKYGLEMKSYKMSSDILYIQDRPSIIWWRNNHFCICCGIDRNENVVICNPDRGRYRMPKQTFEAYYSGIAIFNGIPEDCTEPYTYRERLEALENQKSAEKIEKLEAQNEMLTECIIEMANIIYA